MLLKMCTLALLVSLLSVPSLQEAAQVSSLASANNQFGRSLMDELTLSYKNVVISPYSLHAVLSMTALGARGDTLTEMETALHTSGLTDVHQAYGQLVQSFNDTGNVDVLTANGLFQNPNYTIGSEFKDNATTWFDAVVKELNFTAPGGPEGVINSWVDENTNSMITELFGPNSFDGQTILVLVNTLFFNGSWVNQFSDAVKANFTVNETFTEEVDMMSHTGSYQMKFENDYQVLRVPFEGDRFAMYFTLLNDSAGMLNPTCLPANYDTEKFKNLTSVTADIHIPKFEIKFKKTFNDVLIAMGIVKAFNRSADLSGISNNSYISKVLQEAVIKVMETGTTAAAASGVVVTEYSAPLPPSQVFRVDQPFFFYLRDDTHEEVLFQGKYTQLQDNPSAYVTEMTATKPTCAGAGTGTTDSSTGGITDSSKDGTTDSSKDGAATLHLPLLCWVLSLTYAIFGL